MTEAGLEPSLPIAEPRAGIPPVTDSPSALAEASAALAAGEGPVAVDAERASGFRYGQRAYLVQFYRRGSGTWLIDPTAFVDLSSLQAAISDCEWVLHAASQDLPCLREIGLVPPRIFDTELAGRLLGRERVGLGPLVESELGVHLQKGHGAADWSTRPLPEPWLRYAALDVEMLIELRDKLAGDLIESGKSEWAAQEFQATLIAPPPPPRQDPWRRTSGMHKVRSRRSLAVVRELWYARDEVARERDVSPGRILPDAAIAAAATAMPRSAEQLTALPEFQRAQARRYIRRWWTALERGLEVPEADLPPVSLPGDGPPPPRVWADRDPLAAARLAAARAGLAEVAETLQIPVENLLSPDAVRRIMWKPPDGPLREALAALGARTWQIDVTEEVLRQALEAESG